jgi:hypothetical protein
VAIYLHSFIGLGEVVPDLGQGKIYFGRKFRDSSFCLGIKM